ncbi:MAG: DUF2589 domain-containing protein [Bacteroidia bacterium]
MPVLLQELNDLNFGVYIGGPLQAALHAQHEAAITQVEFIEAVAFEPDPQNPNSRRIRYVEFKYDRVKPNDPNSTESVTLKVPFLAMLPSCSLCIDELNIDFNVKLTSVETQASTRSFTADAELGLKFSKVSFKASMSYKSSNSAYSRVDRSYSLGVHVKAKDMGISRGLDRVLTMMEQGLLTH